LVDLKRVLSKRGGVNRFGAVALLVALAVSAGTVMVQARSSDPTPLPGSAIASVAVASLPVQGREVLEQIRRGGPFRYEKDGAVFGNHERLLPAQKRGFYRQYTVPTPGLSHRGTRRIVCGGLQPRAPDACYYTEDHYNSFRLIVQ